MPSDTFIITQTNENGKSNLIVVPHKWVVDDNCLLWPKKWDFSVETIRKNPTSEPIFPFKKIQCQVKRRGFYSFKSAEEEIDNMMNHTDTDTGADIVPQTSQPKKRKIQKNNIEFDLNSIIELGSPNVSIASSNIEIDTPADPNSNENVIWNEVVMQQNNNEQTALLTEVIDSKISSLMAIVTTNTEKIISLLEDIKQNQTNLSQKSVESHKFSKIASLEDLINFENQCADKNCCSKMVQSLLKYCGVGTMTAQGRTVCYTLSDILFDRHFLTTCSWTGSGHKESKIAFYKYNNMLNMIYSVVVAADPTFSKNLFELFCKQLLRNSKKRCLQSTVAPRKSTQRHHKLKLTQDHLLHNRTENQEEDTE